MRFSAIFTVIAQAVAVMGLDSAFAPGADGKYTISAPGIKAQVRNLKVTTSPGRELTLQQFIDYGASLTNLFVKDKMGMDVDVVLGYDNISYYRMRTPSIAL